MEIPDIRRRVRAAIEQARRDAASRRERYDAAARAYDEFLVQRAIPAFTTVAAALVAEGYQFKVHTPAGAVRLVSERSADDFIELALESGDDPPFVLGRASAGRGRRAVTKERPVREGVGPESLTDEDVVAFVLSEVVPLIER